MKLLKIVAHLVLWVFMSLLFSAMSRHEHIEACKISQIPIVDSSVIYYKDTCFFTYTDDGVESVTWRLRMYLKNSKRNYITMDFDTGRTGRLIFRNLEIPDLFAKEVFRRKEENYNHIEADIVCEAVSPKNIRWEYFTVYLDLSPEKPCMEVILIEPEEELDLTAEEPYGWWKVRFRLLPMSEDAPPATGKFLHIESWADGAIWDKDFVNDTVEADNFYGKEDFFQPLYKNRFGWKYGDTIYPYRYVAGVEPIEHSETLTAYLSREERKIYVKNNGSTQAIQRIEIFDVTGRILKTIEPRDLPKVAVDATDLPRGLLVVQVATKKKIHVFKIWN